MGTTSATQSVTITNTGSELLTDFAGDAPGAPFGAAQNCAGGVAPGASCQFQYTFSPTEEGLATATSTVFTNTGMFSIELEGQGPDGPGL